MSSRRAHALYLAQGGFAAEVAEMLLGYTDYGGTETDPGAQTERAQQPVPDEMLTAERVTERPAGTFAQQALDHATGFR